MSPARQLAQGKEPGGQEDRATRTGRLALHLRHTQAYLAHLPAPLPGHQGSRFPMLCWHNQSSAPRAASEAASYVGGVTLLASGRLQLLVLMMGTHPARSPSLGWVPSPCLETWGGGKGPLGAGGTHQ